MLCCYSMLTRRRGLIFAPFLFMFLACSQPSAQSPKDAEALRKEIDALKAQQAEMQKSLEEIREFLKAATGGRFGAPSLVNSTFDISGLPANGDADGADDAHRDLGLSLPVLPPPRAADAAAASTRSW